MVFNARGRNNSDGTFDWADATGDAAISGGLTFFTTLGALGATGLLADARAGLLAVLCWSRSRHWAAY